MARDRVEKFARSHPKFDALDAAIGKNGWRVVALLRFNAIVPFAVSNYLFGLTSVRFWPFLAASSLGILPGTLFYLSLGVAGKSLREVGPREMEELSAAVGAPGRGSLATAATAVILTASRRRLENGSS